MVYAAYLGIWSAWYFLRWAFLGGAEGVARLRIRRFARRRPDWHLRLYRTPAGFRLLALHRLFVPDEPAVTEFFRAIRADKIYALMCRNQQCFRARVSPKPWRMGISKHIRPRAGAWPIAPERVPERRHWVENYDRVSQGYASCQFIEALNATSPVDPKAQAVQMLHDDLCRALSGLPMA